MQPGDRLLVVCHGNVCRSPFAAAVLRRATLELGVVIESAGFVGPGRPVPARAHIAARDYGICLEDHRSQLLTETMLRAAHLVIVMDERQRARLHRRSDSSGPPMLLGDFDPLPITKRAIHDPWGQSLPVFTEVFGRIERCAEALGLAIASATARVGISGAYTSAYRPTIREAP